MIEIIRDISIICVCVVLLCVIIDCVAAGIRDRR
jgi:hypothetical protein